MKCPYNRLGTKQGYTLNKTYDDSVEVEQKYKFSEIHELMDCTTTNCGVYYRGRCHYNSLSLPEDK